MLALALDVAKARSIENISSGRSKEKLDRLMEAHRVGALGELAVSVFFGLPWEGKYYEGDAWKERGNDVEGLEVRATFRYNGNLVMKEDDVSRFPETPYIFCKLSKVSGGILAKFAGWIYAKEAPDLWEEASGGYENFYIVRTHRLHKMKDLPLNKNKEAI